MRQRVVRQKGANFREGSEGQNWAGETTKIWEKQNKITGRRGYISQEKIGLSLFITVTDQTR